MSSVSVWLNARYQMNVLVTIETYRIYMKRIDIVLGGENSRKLDRLAIVGAIYLVSTLAYNTLKQRGLRGQSRSLALIRLVETAELASC